MRVLSGWAMLTAVLACGSACSGEKLYNLGDINHESGGTGATSGGTGATSSHGGTGATSSHGGTGAQNAGGKAGDRGSDGAASEACDAGNGCVFQVTDAQLVALAADSSTLYWVEYGTFDELKNYRHDGRLMARSFDEPTARVIAANLEGPMAVSVTDEHAFIYLDRAGPTAHRQDLVRIPLTGGDAVLVMADVGDGSYGSARPLVHDGGTADFCVKDSIFRMAPSETEPTLFANITVSAMSLSGDSLYVGRVEGTYRIPLATGAPEQIASFMRSVQASDDYLYAMDDTGEYDIYLTRAPLTGGAWTRLPPKQLGDFASVRIVGDLFFYSVLRNPDWHLFQGNVADPSGAQDVLDFDNQNPIVPWVGTRAGVFWIDSNRIRLRTNAVP